MIFKNYTWTGDITLSVMGGKWKPFLLHCLMTRESLRFSELRECMSPVSSRMLSKCLKELEEDGLVSRMVFAEIPPRTQYTLTSLGRSSSSVLDAIHQWGLAHRRRFE